MGRDIEGQIYEVAQVLEAFGDDNTISDIITALGTLGTTIATAIGDNAYAEADTNGAPSQAQMVSGFGAAATRGAGFKGTFKDTHEGGKCYAVHCDGTSYYYEELTVGA